MASVLPGKPKRATADESRCLKLTEGSRPAADARQHKKARIAAGFFIATKINGTRHAALHFTASPCFLTQETR